MYGGAFSTCRMLSKKKLRITSNISRTARLMRLRGGFEAQRKGDYAICTKNIKKIVCAPVCSTLTILGPIST